MKQITQSTQDTFPNIKISVVVPIYNTPHSHLIRCIQSLLDQNHKNCEILLIDDGSDSEHATFIDELSSMDSRIHVFHKNNAGVSSARNYGMAHITGDVLTFIDSDDWLEPHTWSQCLSVLFQENAQMVTFGWQDHLPDGTLVDHCITEDYSFSTCGKYQAAMAGINPIEETLPDGTKHVSLPRKNRSNSYLICDSRELICEIASDNIHYGGGYPWNKLWRVDSLRDANGLLPQYDESLSIYEDKLWVLQAAARTTTAIIMPQIFYHYMFLPTSLTHKYLDPIDRQPLAYKAYDLILDFLEKNYPEAYIKAYNFYFDVIFDDIHVLKDPAHHQNYREQYDKTVKIYKRLCKRIAPRTLFYPLNSPQFRSWCKAHFLP